MKYGAGLGLNSQPLDQQSDSLVATTCSMDPGLVQDLLIMAQS